MVFKKPHWHESGWRLLALLRPLPLLSITGMLAAMSFGAQAEAHGALRCSLRPLQCLVHLIAALFLQPNFFHRRGICARKNHGAPAGASLPPGPRPPLQTVLCGLLSFRCGWGSRVGCAGWPARWQLLWLCVRCCSCHLPGAPGCSGHWQGPSAQGAWATSMRM